MNPAILLFLLIPISSVVLLFLKDTKKKRKIILNILLILNVFLYLSPLIIAFFNTPPGESMWNENTGGGAAIWLYFIVFPVSVIAQLILLILKIVYATKSM
jgi:hypothetical protein